MNDLNDQVQTMRAKTFVEPHKTNELESLQELPSGMSEDSSFFASDLASINTVEDLIKACKVNAN